MSDQTQNQSEESPKTFDKMPSIEEFKALDSDTQKALIAQFPEAIQNDQEEEKSETSEQESSVEDQPKQDEPAESEKETQPEPQKEDNPFEKKYKELEAEFTRRSQRMRELERENKDLKESKVPVGQAPSTKSPLDMVVETHPQAKVLADALREEIRMRLETEVEKGIKPIAEKITHRQEEDNLGKFQTELKSFFESPLGKLETEFNQIAGERFENQDALLAEARKDPALFTNLQKELLSRHFVKAAQLVAEPKVTPEDKSRIVQQTGVSGKAKTTTNVDDELDLKVFKNKSSDEMKKILARHGAVQSS